MDDQELYPEWFLQLRNAIIALKEADESVSEEDETLALSSPTIPRSAEQST